MVGALRRGKAPRAFACNFVSSPLKSWLGLGLRMGLLCRLWAGLLRWLFAGLLRGLTRGLLCQLARGLLSGLLRVLPRGLLCELPCGLFWFCAISMGGSCEGSVGGRAGDWACGGGLPASDVMLSGGPAGRFAASASLER